MIKKKDVHAKSEMGSSFCNLTNPDHHDRVFSMVIDFDTNPQLEVQITIHDGIVKVIVLSRDSKCSLVRTESRPGPFNEFITSSSDPYTYD